VAGAFIQLSSDNQTPFAGSYSAAAAARALLGASLDLSFALAPSFSFEAQLGNLRWVPGGSGAILLAGVTAGAVVRF
jgi:hypothetical protein